MTKGWTPKREGYIGSQKSVRYLQCTKLDEANPYPLRPDVRLILWMSAQGQGSAWLHAVTDVEVREIGGSHTDAVSANDSRILARNIDETLEVD